MNKEIHLILDNIRSRENVGSILRTADAVGVKHIYLCGITPIPPHPKIEKASLGAEKFVPWSYIRNTWRIVTDLKKRGVKIIGLEQSRKSQDIFSSASNKLKADKLALIVGNEVKGISPKILKYCDKIVHIPMHGKKESLNVSVATGIVLYQIRNV